MIKGGESGQTQGRGISVRRGKSLDYWYPTGGGVCNKGRSCFWRGNFVGGGGGGFSSLGRKKEKKTAAAYVNGGIETNTSVRRSCIGNYNITGVKPGGGIEKSLHLLALSTEGVVSREILYERDTEEES